MTPQDRPLLSIIIPAYNEQERLPASLDQLVEFATRQDYGIEVIVVNNNSSDQTSEIAAEYASRYEYIRTLDEPRQGKGAAVNTGIMAGKGDYLFVCDTDFSMPVEEISKFMPPALNSYDIAIASRELPESRRVDEPAYRHLMGRVFNFIVRVLAIPKIHDTQCGFKVFCREVADKVFPMQTIDGWAFDVEILFVAQRLGYSIVEVPITWHYMPQSRISPLRDSINMLVEVIRVRLNGWRGKYGSKR
jgi:glycosyltransferase involved in cell wall biosynthesis